MADIRISALNAATAVADDDILHGIDQTDTQDKKFTLSLLSTYFKSKNPAGVTSVFGRTGAVVATNGDYTLTQLGDVVLTSPASGNVLSFDGTNWKNTAAPATGVTSIAVRSPITDTGTAAKPSIGIQAASKTQAGSMSASDKSKLDGIAISADVFIPTNLGYTQSTRVLTSSTGSPTTLPVVTNKLPGLMSAADKARLDGINGGNASYTLPTASASVKGGIKIGTGLKMTGEVCSTDISGGLTFLSVKDCVATGPTGSESVGEFYIHEDGVSGSTNAGWSADGTLLPTSLVGREIIARGTSNWVKLGVVGSSANITGISFSDPIFDNGGGASSPNIAIKASSATQAGSMSAGQADKLEKIEAGAQKNVAHDLGHVTAASDVKVTISNGNDTTLPAANASKAGVMTAAMFNKLGGIDTGAKDGTVTSIKFNAPLTGGTITSSGTVGLTDNGLTERKYTLANVTVNKWGLITAIENGTETKTGTVTEVKKTGTIPLTITNPTTTPTLSMPAATTSADGYMTSTQATQLSNLVSSGSYTLPAATTSVRGGIKVGSYLNTTNTDKLNVNASSTNTSNAVVARDGNGDFEARDVTVRNLTASGNVCAYTTSDARLKDIQEPVKNVSFENEQLWAYYYRWNDGRPGPITDIGFLAQDVQKIYPMCVREGADGFLQVDYARLVVPLWQQVKEMSLIIKELMRRMDSLEDNPDDEEAYAEFRKFLKREAGTAGEIQE